MEQTALLIIQYNRGYISDLVNDFKEINGCTGGKMYRTGFGYSCYLNVSFDGERFLFNESKVENMENIDLTDFNRKEIASCCLPYHMVTPKYYTGFESYCQLINATDTRLLWKIESPRKCKNRNCPIREGFQLLVEQDFLINSREGNGNEYKTNLCVKKGRNIYWTP